MGSPVEDRTHEPAVELHAIGRFDPGVVEAGESDVAALDEVRYSPATHDACSGHEERDPGQVVERHLRVLAHQDPVAGEVPVVGGEPHEGGIEGPGVRAASDGVIEASPDR